MQDFEDILEMFEDYKRDPRPMDQEPRNMYNKGKVRERICRNISF